MKRFKNILFTFIFIMLIFTSAVSASDDDYIRGYAEAILKEKFKVATYSLTVKEGIITLRSRDIADKKRDELINALSNITGVVKVNILEGERIDGIASSDPYIRTEPKSQWKISSLLKKERIFNPLIADPRWPHFSIAYQYYIDDEELRNVGATSFGETLPLYRNNAPFGGQWQIGIQAAVFGIFDLDAESLDLINADYWVGIPVSYRKDKLSALIRIYHQSSHLGDEYILRSRVDRVNLSYEAVDMKVSYELDRLRLYGGSGFIFSKEPYDLKPWSVQYGLETKGQKGFFGGSLIPVAGADFKNRQESDWSTDISLRAGFQIESVKLGWNTLYLMLEYFNGHTPNGQFYERSIEYWSIASHFYF